MPVPAALPPASLSSGPAGPHPSAPAAPVAASSARPAPHAHTAACNHAEGPEKTLIAATKAGKEAGVNAALSSGESTHQKDEVCASTVAYACIRQTPLPPSITERPNCLVVGCRKGPRGHPAASHRRWGGSLCCYKGGLRHTLMNPYPLLRVMSRDRNRFRVNPFCILDSQRALCRMGPCCVFRLRVCLPLVARLWSPTPPSLSPPQPPPCPMIVAL